jgi:hypothetical protein
MNGAFNSFKLSFYQSIDENQGWDLMFAMFESLTSGSLAKSNCNKFLRFLLQLFE